MFGFREVPEQREKEILAELEQAARVHTPYLVLVASSAIIATFGLLLNSPAVVIGAMLVAPLMTPIFSTSVALVRGRTRMLEQALVTEIYGVGLSVLVALLIGLLVPEPDLTAEIVARTRPTLFDLAVALAAGLAGAFALVREEISPALPGVAIAVALLPPLAVVGIGLSMRRLDVAGGALVLFLANGVAIHLISAGVFYVSGLASHAAERSPRILLKSFAPSLVVLAVMTVFLGFQLSGLVQEARAKRVARTTLEQQVKMVEGARLRGTDRVSCSAEGCEVVAVVETPQLFEPPLVRAIQNVLRDRMGREVSLVIRSVQMSEATAQGYRFLGEGAAAAKPEPPRVTESPKLSAAERIQKLLGEQAAMVQGAKLVDFSFDAAAQPPHVVATYLTASPFDAALEQGIANLVRAQTGQEVTVEIRYVGPLPGRETPNKTEEKKPSAPGARRPG